MIFVLLFAASSSAFATDYYGSSGIVGQMIGDYGAYPQTYSNPYDSYSYGSYYNDTYNYNDYSYGGYSYPAYQSVDAAAAAAGYGTPYTDYSTPYTESNMFGDYPPVQGAYLENPEAYSAPQLGSSIASPAGMAAPAIAAPPALAAQLATRTDVSPGSAYYSITYDPGHYSSGGTSSTVYSAGTVVTLQGQIYTRPGYIQTGWTEVDGGARMYNLFQPVSVTRNMVLYPYLEVLSAPVYLTVNIVGNGTVRLSGGNVPSGWSGKLEPGQSFTFSFYPGSNNYVYSILLGGSYRALNYGNSFMVTYEMMQGKNQTMYIRFNSIYSSPKTGDDSNIVLWSVLGFISFSALSVISIYRKKQY